MAGTAPQFDWSSFYALFWNDKGLRCKVNIPDTVLFRYGQLSAWWATNKEGAVQRHTSASTCLEAIRKRFLQAASDDDGNYSKFVAISRTAGDGRPHLLRLQAFNHLCEMLSDRLEAGYQDACPDMETPIVLQSFAQPMNDIRYVTTYLNQGSAVVCHTFQRKFSRRYVPQTSTMPDSTSTDVQDADIIMAANQNADALRAELDQTQGSVDPAVKMQLRKLTCHIVKYIETAHGLTLGGLVCEYIRDVAGKVYLLSVMRTEWASNASGHGAGSFGAASLVAEAAEVDADLTPEEPDAGSPGLARRMGDADGLGRNSLPGPCTPDANSPSTSPLRPTDDSPRLRSPRPESASPSRRDPAFHHATSAVHPTPHRRTIADGSGQQLPVTVVRPQSAYTSFSGGALPNSRPHGTPRASLVQYPGGQRSTSSQNLGLTNTWPSLQHEQNLSPGRMTTGRSRTPSPEPAGKVELGVVGSGRPHSAWANNHTNDSSRARQPRTQSARPANRAMVIRGPVPANATSGGGSPRFSTSDEYRPVSSSRECTTQPNGSMQASNFTAWASGPALVAAGGSLALRVSPGTGLPRPATGHTNSGPRGAPLMMAQMTRELEAVKEQLLFQHQMAEASAAKVRELEHDKQVVVASYKSRLHALDHSLQEARTERDAFRSQLAALMARTDNSETRMGQLELQNAELQMTLDRERGTVMTAIADFQAQGAVLKSRDAQMESEVLRLADRLKEETTTVNALKRQLMEYSEIADRFKTTLKDGFYEPGMQDTLDKVQQLFVSQDNPHGETYAVQKVLAHYYADLRAIFLFYAQLQRDFAAHWPPSLGFAQFMIFCRDTETSDPRHGAHQPGVPGSRAAPTARVLKPSECEAVFNTYAALDLEAINSSAPVLTYESFLACIVDLSSRLRKRDQPYLSEGLRDYVLRNLSRANKVVPAQLSKGQMREALEGVKTKIDHVPANNSAHAGALPVHTSSGKKSGKASSRPGSNSSSRPGSALPARSPSPLGHPTIPGHGTQMSSDMALLGYTNTKVVTRSGGGFSVTDK